MGDNMHLPTSRGRVVPFRRGPQQRVNGLGWVAAAASAYGAYQANKNSGSSNTSGGSSTAGAPAQPTSATSVSPTIQQQFTPQISPVFQQSSGGGSQTASTQQIAPGGQSGKGGDATATPAGGEAYPGYAAPAPAALPTMYDPFAGNTDAVKYGTGSNLIPKKTDNTMIYVIGGVVLLALAAVIFTNTGSSKKGA